MAKPTKRIINSFHQSLRLCEFPPIPNNGFSHSGHFRSGISIPSKSHEEIARNPCFGGGLSRILFAKTHRYPPCIGNRVQSYSNGVLRSGFRSLRGLDAKTSSSGPLGLGSALNPTSPIRVFSQIFAPRRCFHTSLVENSCKSHSHGAFPPGFSISRLKIPYRRTNLRGLGYRFFSSVGKFDRGSMIKKPLEALSSTASRYRGAIGLQIEAFWKRNYLVLVGAVAVVLCLLLWRVMFGIANMFVGFSEGMAKYGFLALAWAMVAFTGLYIRSRLSINPDKVYRIAMRKLNTSAGILEVMGAPLTGTDLRAYVMSGGGPSLKNFKLKLGGKRCFLIFPIRGSERRALVSVEVKKKKGQYDIKLLAVDIPMTSGPDQRIFLIGNEEEYRVGGGLISELRDPIVKAMAAEKEFEDLDEKEEQEDEERELLEEEERRKRELEEEEEQQRQREELAKMEKGS